MNATELVDGQGLISPDVFPISSSQVSSGANWLREQADRAAKLARDADEAAGSLAQRWGFLSDWYRAPESEQLFVAMTPVVKVARDEAEKAATGGKAQGRIADELDTLAEKLANVENSARALRKSALDGHHADQGDVDAGRVVIVGKHSHLLPPEIRRGGPLEGTVWIDWRCWRQSVEGNDAQLVEAARVVEAIRQVQEDLARTLQSLQDDGSGRERAWAWNSGRAPVVPQGVPGSGWFDTATPEQVRDWWNSLSSAEQAAAADRIAVMDLDQDVVNALLSGALETVAQSELPADVETLNAVLSAFGEDDDAMAAALAAAGGGVVAAALDRLGRASRPMDRSTEHRVRAMKTAEALRDEVAQASHAWDSGQAKAYAHDLFEQVKEQRSASVAYLFADPETHPMSESLTLALADELDTWERTEGDGTTIAHLYRYSQDGAFALGNGVDGPALSDPMGRVLETLGTYPDAALDWLTTSADDPATNSSLWNDWFGDELPRLGAARVDYYFGVRDSGGGAIDLTMRAAGSGDGFAGVSALWAGAQHAEGSLLDLRNDAGVQREVAALSTQIFEKLAENPHLNAEGMTAHGSDKLATAVTLQNPQLAVNGISGEPSGTNPATTALFPIDGAEYRDNSVSVVDADRGTIASVIGPALTRAEGMAVAAEASNDYSRDVRESLAESADTIATGDAIRQARRALKLDAAYEGARIGALADAAERSEAEARSIVDYGVGYVAGKWDAPGGYAGGRTKGAGAGQLTEFVVDMLSGHAEEVRREEAERAIAVDQLAERKSRDFGNILARHYDLGGVDQFVDDYRGEVDTMFQGWKVHQK